MINPYAALLGERDPREVIAESPERLRDIVETLGPAGFERSLAPGKWTAREILCHLADCELVFAFRLRQTLAEDHHVIQPFDQDKWAETYASYGAHAALAVFTAVRNWNIRLIEGAPASAFIKPLTHPERGTMTFRTVVETMGGHDLNHRVQLERIAAMASSA
jgi:uncharacterized damage-inducible protein DinB